MPKQKVLIDNFYTAFRQKNAQVMQEAYHPEATFNDPVFKGLNAFEAGKMWEMFITSGNTSRLLKKKQRA